MVRVNTAQYGALGQDTGDHGDLRILNDVGQYMLTRISTCLWTKTRRDAWMRPLLTCVL